MRIPCCWIPVLAAVAIVLLGLVEQKTGGLGEGGGHSTRVCERRVFGQPVAGRGFVVCEVGSSVVQPPRLCVPARLPAAVSSLLPNTTLWCSQVLAERVDGTTTRLVLPHTDAGLEPVVVKEFASDVEWHSDLAALRALNGVSGTPVLLAAAEKVTIVEQAVATRTGGAGAEAAALEAAATALGSVHAATRGVAGEGEDGGSRDARRFRRWVSYLAQFAEANQVAYTAGEELATIADALASPPTSLAVLVHGDVCLDNVVGTTLLDFSRSGFGRHAALDVAAPTMGLPTCFAPRHATPDLLADLSRRYAAAGGPTLTDRDVCVGATYYALLHVHEVHAKQPWDPCGRRTVVSCAANVMARLDAYDRACGGRAAPFPRTASLLRRLRLVLAADWAVTEDESRWELPRVDGK